MDRYVQAMELHLQANNVSRRLEKLETSAEHMTERLFEEEFEKISRNVDDAMRYGINTVKRKNVG